MQNALSPINHYEVNTYQFIYCKFRLRVCEFRPY